MADIWRAIDYLRSHWRSTLGAFISLIFVSGLTLVTPRIIQIIIDQGIEAQNLTVVWISSLGLLGIALVRNLLTFAETFWIEKASQGVAFDARNDLFTKISRLSFSYHDKSQTGQLMTRVTNDVDTVSAFIGNGLLQIVNTILLLIGSAIILLIMNWQLGGMVLMVIPMIMVVFARFFQMVGPRYRVVAQKLGNLNTVLQENLAGIRVVKAFAREPYEHQRFRGANDDLLQETLAVVRGASSSFSLVFFIANVGTIVVIWSGGLQVINQTLSIGELVAFNTYLTYLLMPIFILGSTLTSMPQAAASARRIFEVLDAPIDITDQPDATPLPPVQGRVAFENVTFTYAGSTIPSLAELSFVAEPGQTIAIVGQTGAGKSTIINLIPRFYDVTSGRVTVDGYDVREAILGSLRAQIGIVLQESILFGTTIRENIAFGRPDATHEQIEAVARAAQAHTFIAELPQGYDTVVGERGIGLSGGQRQRIAIARALLLDPALLILDDSTSAVDAETEYHIQQALEQLMQNRTSFVIAQRMSTVRHADKILVLDKGHLVAQGSHEELLTNCELYCELVNTLVSDRKESTYSNTILE